ncbi:phenylacetate-CoA oxygenase subunit PaaJ [Kytococcus schroeteri]|uniref:Phenylacetate-CoA oxygenase subunit PaaJ n=1 Tax=Kytococcus schroeteri TaxID=138300 RepID=A0A2I1P9R6_9MICO|nr:MULTISPECIES: 1,2-phenylacetyl-CoA epoxidase subunit PaaD [Kytococcus]PKZ41331.1 phenylacetate-CoA oxygenase subunit PaaJ [Kytococcus schroeteri]
MTGADLPAAGAGRAPVEEVLRALESVPDPEIPVITLADLGVLRSVEADEDRGTVHVVMTPTYSGCPAMEVMEGQVARAVALRGWDPEVERRLDPPWTTDWMTDEGREKLRAFGIAPPGPAGAARSGPADGPVGLQLQVRQVRCPACGSADTEELARFGSTACKALRRCRACREPFDEFKPL